MLFRARYSVLGPICAIALLTIASFPLAAQAGADDVLRTAHGDPDISGIFTFRTLTPLERPSALSGKEALGRRRGSSIRGLREQAPEPGSFRPGEGGAQRRLCPSGRGWRAVVQRVLVRARHRTDGGQTHLPDR